MNLRKTVLLCLLATLSISGSALAATGTVNATKKTAEFTGTIDDPAFGMYDLVMFFNKGTEVRGKSLCVDPACDTHTLTVGPGGAQLKLDATSDANNLSLEIIDPKGTRKSINEVAATPEHHLTFDATQGDWTVRVYGGGNSDTFDYNITATFLTPDDVPVDPGG